MGLFKISTSRKGKNQSSSSSTTDPPQQNAYTTHHERISTSNLSTISTLAEQTPARPELARLTSYEAFIRQAQIDAQRKETREYAWRVAAQRRMDESSRPWTGGFAPKRVGGQGVERWLKGNGLRK
jgi:hypothetical protein